MRGGEGQRRVRLPLATNDQRQRPARDVHSINPRRVPSTRRYDGAPMNQIDDAAHLSRECGVPVRIVVSLFLLSWRWLRPDTLNEPECAVGMIDVPAGERAIEVRRMNRVYA